MNSINKILFLVAISLLSASAKDIETISDDSLVQIIQSEENVIVFFTKHECEECDKIHKHLLNLEEDFKDQLGAEVVQVFSSQMVRLYNAAKEPTLVYFRHGIPLLYDGPIDEDEIMQRFTDNKSPIARELSDEIFEHLTQASTGATTGDWFIFFYSPDCVDCQRLTAVWEAVGAAIKNRVNVARVNRLGAGISTAKRFGVQKSPEFIFLRQGKFYRYEIPKFDVKSFVSFAQEWYRNARGEKVPIPASPFDGVVSKSVEYLAKGISLSVSTYRDYPYFVYAGAIVTGLICLVGVYSTCIAKKKVTAQKTKKAK